MTSSGKWDEKLSRTLQRAQYPGGEPRVKMGGVKGAKVCALIDATELEGWARS